jgi:hypothetical protein
MRNEIMKSIGWHRFAAGAMLLVAGMVAGSALHAPNEAWGEVRGTPPPAAFQSGGQLSVPLLKDIATTLHQIDARLARLETAAQKLQKSGAGAP